MIRINRLFKSYGYAVKGLFKIFREEQNLKIQIFASLLVLILGIYFCISRIEWAVLTLVVCLVLIAEITNSAVERIADVFKPRINTYVKEIKDIMAAAVFLSSIAAIVVGIIIFFPYVYKFF
ncbi:diacylglycerol kinase [Patescibacteria group bacterium]|nr:diacylglycerol kinase [Patescibacteria group bacterium]MBU1663569.1 diacylglycerol kinase [Patescibacteria group bacterium]MBU1934193.1 diacylglycerol kinase [Patescibacteria group bacterium]MBU2007593.1 diacylglycerol kinase [Patescibacteria group bacterium]MBU2233805.1 diacylglycerol kinase [Patescibacteria group bacterium]